jgi:hypothetical protein
MKLTTFTMMYNGRVVSKAWFKRFGPKNDSPSLATQQAKQNGFININGANVEIKWLRARLAEIDAAWHL